MYRVAMRTASIAVSKQSEALRAATTASGDSPFRPQSACIRSACSVFVGSPVLGPPRWTLTITTGSSVVTANPIASAFKVSPGPLVIVRAI